MTTAPEQEVARSERALRDWFKAHHPDLQAIDLDFDLVESRAIDSLQFMEFLALLEDLTGHEIDVNSLSADSFRTLRAIRDRFFDGAWP